MPPVPPKLRDTGIEHHDIILLTEEDASESSFTQQQGKAPSVSFPSVSFNLPTGFPDGDTTAELTHDGDLIPPPVGFDATVDSLGNNHKNKIKNIKPISASQAAAQHTISTKTKDDDDDDDDTSSSGASVSTGNSTTAPSASDATKPAAGTTPDNSTTPSVSDNSTTAAKNASENATALYPWRNTNINGAWKHNQTLRDKWQENMTEDAIDMYDDPFNYQVMEEKLNKVLPDISSALIMPMITGFLIFVGLITCMFCCINYWKYRWCPLTGHGKIRRREFAEITLRYRDALIAKGDPLESEIAEGQNRLSGALVGEGVYMRESNAQTEMKALMESDEEEEDGDHVGGGTYLRGGLSSDEEVVQPVDNDDIEDDVKDY